MDASSDFFHDLSSKLIQNLGCNGNVVEHGLKAVVAQGDASTVCTKEAGLQASCLANAAAHALQVPSIIPGLENSGLGISQGSKGHFFCPPPCLRVTLDPYTLLLTSLP